MQCQCKKKERGSEPSCAIQCLTGLRLITVSNIDGYQSVYIQFLMWNTYHLYHHIALKLNCYEQTASIVSTTATSSSVYFTSVFQFSCLLNEICSRALLSSNDKQLQSCWFYTVHRLSSECMFVTSKHLKCKTIEILPLFSVHNCA
jgi:hypothetical protein